MICIVYINICDLLLQLLVYFPHYFEFIVLLYVLYCILLIACLSLTSRFVVCLHLLEEKEKRKNDGRHDEA